MREVSFDEWLSSGKREREHAMKCEVRRVWREFKTQDSRQRPRRMAERTLNLR